MQLEVILLIIANKDISLGNWILSFICSFSLQFCELQICFHGESCIITWFWELGTNLWEPCCRTEDQMHSK